MLLKFKSPLRKEVRVNERDIGIYQREQTIEMIVDYFCRNC